MVQPMNASLHRTSVPFIHTVMTVHARTRKTKEFLEGSTQLGGLKKICADDTVITVVAVDNRCHKHGIGSMLVQNCIKNARRHGSFAVYGHCYDGNNGASAAMLKWVFFFKTTPI